MAKYYKFLVHLGDDTYNNIILGDKVTIISDIEKPEIQDISSIDSINILYNHKKKKKN